MESRSGDCQKAPDGQHHWKYGKCNYCASGAFGASFSVIFIDFRGSQRRFRGPRSLGQRPEGKLVKGSGAVANPGSAGGCAEGGKCAPAEVFMAVSGWIGS